MKHLTQLKIVFFNMNGLIGPTALENEFQELVGKYDILCLTETWHAGEHDLENNNKFIIPKDYTYLHKARIKRNKKAKRHSGGIVVIYKKEFKDIITVHDKTDENIFWIKINGNELDNQNDLYIATIYNSPENSSWNIVGIYFVLSFTMLLFMLFYFYFS